MKSSLLSLIAALLFSSVLLAQETKTDGYQQRFPSSVKQTPDSEARLDKWYRDAKYGAFVHFGVYSMLGGEYQGKIAKQNYSEWVQVNLRIPAEEYHAVASKFNPTQFDADQWVKVFKDCGMKYVVITSKHHDGFALFDSAVSDYNVVDHTPLKRDIIKELDEACHRSGLKFGVYYSQSQDWDASDAPHMRKRTRAKIFHPDLPHDFKPDIDRYIADKALPQVEELAKNYELDLIWFDTPLGMTPERAKLFSDVVRKYRPDCLINSRILLRTTDPVTEENVRYFDYGSLRDKEIPPAPPEPGAIYVESPDSVSNSYGYKNHGNVQYHSEKELIDRMVHTVCNGGNYLLNNGPMGNGQLDPDSVRLYRALGAWLKVNGEAIYDTRSNPLGRRPQWGDISTSKDSRTLYLHILKWPESGTISVDGLDRHATAATFLTDGEIAQFNQSDDVLKIRLPPKALDQYDTVVKVSLK